MRRTLECIASAARIAWIGAGAEIDVTGSNNFTTFREGVDFNRRAKMTTQYWITGTAGDWSDAAEWRLGVAPTSTDDAAIGPVSAPTDDDPASTATTGDANRFKVTLVAGATYQFGLQGGHSGEGTLQYSTLTLLDSSGNELIGDYGASASGSGPGLNDRITYTAPQVGDLPPRRPSQRRRRRHTHAHREHDLDAAG